MAEIAVADVTLRIEGMHCGSCIRRVTQAINQAINQAIHQSLGPIGESPDAVEPFAVKEVRLGAARFTAPEGSEAVAADLAIAALSKAGFEARVER